MKNQKRKGEEKSESRKELKISKSQTNTSRATLLEKLPFTINRF